MAMRGGIEEARHLSNIEKGKIEEEREATFLPQTWKKEREGGRGSLAGHIGGDRSDTKERRERRETKNRSPMIDSLSRKAGDNL